MFSDRRIRSENLLVGHKELDVSQAPEVSNGKTAQVAEEAGVGDENGDEEVDDQGSGPSGNVVRTEGKVGVLFTQMLQTSAQSRCSFLQEGDRRLAQVLDRRAIGQDE
ncbi:hypothetical protein KCV07_g6, partial [Aureobasidium melanogenum]